MKISIKFVLRNVFIHIFILSFIASFFFPSYYKTIVEIQFYLLAPIVVLLNYNYRSLYQSLLVIFLIFTGLTIMFGVPGSAFGFAVSATLGLFMAEDSVSNSEGNSKVDQRLFLFSTLCYIIASIHLIYSNIQNLFDFEKLGEYFGTASINYASITVASFCSIFAVWAAKRQYYGSHFTNKQMRWSRIFAVILASTILTLSIIFSTRSAIFGFLPPLLFALQPKRPFLYFALIGLGLVIVYFIFPVFAELVISLMAPGRDSLTELYETELNGQERSESAMQIFAIAIPYFSFCTSCSEHLSFSGISNLIALSFPFSLFFIIQITRFIILFIKNFIVTKKSDRLFFLIIGVSFLNAFLLSVFQADFLSMLSLFYVVGSGLFFSSKIFKDRNKYTIQPV